MTAADLLTDPEFTAFCLLWKRNGRCPLVFADWLRDRGLDGQADGAEWAALEPDRVCVGWGKRPLGGVCPWPTGDGHYVWFVGREGLRPMSDQLPADVHAKTTRLPRGRGLQCLDFCGSVALLLDAWASARTPATA